MILYMVTPTNHAIAGPDLHRAGPLAVWEFLQHLSAKYREDQKKSYDLSVGPLAGTAPCHGQSALVNALCS